MSLNRNAPRVLGGAIPEALGITIVNGTNALMANNQVTGGTFGIWPCDAGGKVLGNKASGCLEGIILCKVPGVVVRASG